jgi:hypothetical protein
MTNELYFREEIMSTFRTIIPETITDNTFTLINKDWMLITAGSKDSFNTMTGAWGELGVLPFSCKVR